MEGMVPPEEIQIRRYIMTTLRNIISLIEIEDTDFVIYTETVNEDGIQDDPEFLLSNSGNYEQMVYELRPLMDREVSNISFEPEEVDTLRIMLAPEEF
jgi:hypothetical protein